jgi:hypothetical protein
MARNDRLEPGRIKRILEKSKYSVSGKIGARKTRLKAKGIQKIVENNGFGETTEILSENVLTLELECIEGEWRPVPPVGEDFTSAPSLLHAVARGVTTRAYIRNRTDLERILIKIGVLEASEEWVEQHKKRGGYTRRGFGGPGRVAGPETAAKPKEQAVAKQAAGKKAVKKVVAKKVVAKKVAKKAVTKKAAVKKAAAKKVAKKAAVKKVVAKKVAKKAAVKKVVAKKVAKKTGTGRRG